MNVRILRQLGPGTPAYWEGFNVDAEDDMSVAALLDRINYTSGEHFFGALFANDCYLVAARNKTKAGEVKALYDKHFGRDCSKALSCMDVCPVGISTIASMARLNR